VREKLSALVLAPCFALAKTARKNQNTKRMCELSCLGTIPNTTFKHLDSRSVQFQRFRVFKYIATTDSNNLIKLISTIDCISPKESGLNQIIMRAL